MADAHTILYRRTPAAYYRVDEFREPLCVRLADHGPAPRSSIASFRHEHILAVAARALPEQAALPASNPFAAPSPLPFNYPQFDRIKDSDFAPAFDAGMAEQLAEVRRDRRQPRRRPPSTTHWWRWRRAVSCWSGARRCSICLVSADTNDARNQLRDDYAPRFAAHDDAIHLDGKLFARIQTLYDSAPSWAWTRRACACWSATTPTSCTPARKLSRRRQGKAEGAQRRAGHADHAVRPERARRSQ